MKNTRNAILAAATIAGLAAARTAEAQSMQINPAFYGSAEIDTRDTQFYLLGLYLGVGGSGWRPYANVNAYSLHYKSGGERRTLQAFSPTVGMTYNGARGGVSFGVGYAFVDNENPDAVGTEQGGSSGVTLSFGARHEGEGNRPLRTQFLSNYNTRSKYIWTRTRASVPFGNSERHPMRLGGEFVAQGGRHSNSFAVGPFLEYQWTPNFRTTGVVGYKSVDGDGDGRESAAYLKLEFSFSP